MQHAIKTAFEAGQNESDFIVPAQFKHVEADMQAAYEAGVKAGPDKVVEFDPETHKAEKVFKEKNDLQDKYDLLLESFRTSEKRVSTLEKKNFESDKIILDFTDEITGLRKENSHLKKENKSLKSKLSEGKPAKKKTEKKK
jgi:hypothetical protein